MVVVGIVGFPYMQIIDDIEFSGMICGLVHYYTVRFKDNVEGIYVRCFIDDLANFSRNFQRQWSIGFAKYHIQRSPVNLNQGKDVTNALSQLGV